MVFCFGKNKIAPISEFRENKFVNHAHIFEAKEDNKEDSIDEVVVGVPVTPTNLKKEGESSRRGWSFFEDKSVVGSSSTVDSEKAASEGICSLKSRFGSKFGGVSAPPGHCIAYAGVVAVAVAGLVLGAGFESVETVDAVTSGVTATAAGLGGFF